MAGAPFEKPPWKAGLHHNKQNKYKQRDAGTLWGVHPSGSFHGARALLLGWKAEVGANSEGGARVECGFLPADQGIEGKPPAYR